MHAAIPIFVMIAAGGLMLAVLVAACSRHKKSGTGKVQLIGATGFAETRLDPDGTVIIDGELWHARSCTGTAVGPKERVAVVSLDDHFLLVEVIQENG